MLADAITTDPPSAQRAGRRRFPAALRAHGHALENLRSPRATASIEVGDHRPAVQAQAITELTVRLRDRAPWSDPRAHQAGLASLLPALAVTPALTKAAAANVRAGRWLEPADGRLLRWRKVSNDLPVTGTVEPAIARSRADASTATTHAGAVAIPVPARGARPAIALCRPAPAAQPDDAGTGAVAAGRFTSEAS